MANTPSTVQEWILGFVSGLNEHEEDVLNEQVNITLEPFLDEPDGHSPSVYRFMADVLALQQALGREVPEIEIEQFRDVVQSLINDIADDIDDDEYDLEHYDGEDRTEADKETIRQGIAKGKEDLAVVEGVLAKFNAACIENGFTD